jgi:hypothetical protein
MCAIKVGKNVCHRVLSLKHTAREAPGQSKLNWTLVERREFREAGKVLVLSSNSCD